MKKEGTMSTLSHDGNLSWKLSSFLYVMLGVATSSIPGTVVSVSSE